MNASKYAIFNLIKTEAYFVKFNADVPANGCCCSNHSRNNTACDTTYFCCANIGNLIDLCSKICKAGNEVNMPIIKVIFFKNYGLRLIYRLENEFWS